MTIRSKKNLPKNIIYFIREIFIIVLGIFIAVQINNWNDFKKNRVEEEKALFLLGNDLMTEKRVLLYFIEDLAKSETFLEEFLINKELSENIDSIGYYLDRGYIQQKSNAAYVNLKHSGQLNIITNQEIKARVVFFYETSYDGNRFLSDWNQNFNRDNIIPYLLNNFTTKADDLLETNEVKQAIGDRKFMNLIKHQRLMFEQIRGQLEGKMLAVENLLKQISDEVEMSNN